MECHGLQCGYCTPGMMITAKWLLENNPNPTEHEIRDGLSGQLCRCTGYHNIVEAVRYAADKHEQPGGLGVTDTAVPTSAAGNPIGFGRMLRKEDVRFVRGKGRYVDDIQLPEHAARSDPAQPVRARPDRVDRHLGRRSRTPTCTP